jgi:RHS repeat-associated protein
VDDPSTGLTHLGAREYDSKLGRFISVDSILDVSDPITLNGYRYGNNSPASYSDPEGLRDMLETPDDFGTPPATGEHHTWREKSPEEVEEISHKVILSEVSHHREAKEEAKRVIRKVIKNLVKIVADELGITDALNCFTDGDIGACLSTGVTVLSSFAGGVAGKLLSKYLLHAKKAWKLVGRIKDLIGEAIDGIKGFRKAEEELHKAEEAASNVCAINSFVPGTLVLLADGTRKSIEKLELNDKVIASDPISGKSLTEPVTRTIIGRGMKDLVDITITTSLRDGSRRSAIVTATAGHRFFVPKRMAWIDAGGIAVGDHLAGRVRGQMPVVTAVRAHSETTTVYNLTISGIHTYFVAAGSTLVLTHNCGGPGRELLGEDAGHILEGHAHPGIEGKTLFPKEWSHDDILDAVADVATSPASTTTWKTGSAKFAERSLRTRKGEPAVQAITGTVRGIDIEVRYVPLTGRVLTAFPY